jgi:hypothetical protein
MDDGTDGFRLSKAISVTIPRSPRREWIAEIMEHINEFYTTENLPFEIDSPQEKAYKPV